MNNELRTKNLKIAVLAGGVGSERAISLMSGENVYKALQMAGFETVYFDISPSDLSMLKSHFQQEEPRFQELLSPPSNQHSLLL